MTKTYERPVGLVAVLLTLVLAAGSARAQPTEPKDLTAVVAAWNVKDVPAPDADDADRVTRLATGIAWLDPEVVLLTEAGRTVRMQNLLTQLNAFGAQYVMELVEQTASDQIAILFKQGVTVSNVQLLAGSDDGNQYLRKAVTATVDIGEFDFVLVGVHLKAGRGSDAHDIRTRQAEVIATFIETATAGTEKDVVVVGDYNMVPQQNGDPLNVTALWERSEYARSALYSPIDHIEIGQLPIQRWWNVANRRAVWSRD